MASTDTTGTCGCCDGISVDTPQKVHNRAGLSAISYRIGRHYDFKKSLLAKLTLSRYEALQKLTSRSDDDFTVALIDAFSTVADVLTFYQERIANESYLQTARELLSSQEQAYLIGYHPRPGVAASTFLAFTLENKTALPGKEAERGMRSAENDFPNVTIPVATKVQSVPEQDELPQYFETIEEIVAKADWNAMPVKTTKEQTAISSKNTIYADGTDFNLKTGDQILLFDNDTPYFKKVDKATVRDEEGMTEIQFQVSQLGAFMVSMVMYPVFNTELTYLIDTNIGSSVQNIVYQGTSLTQKEANVAMSGLKKSQPPGTRVVVFRETANLFGYNAPPKMRYLDNLGNNDPADDVIREAEWSLNADDTNKTYIHLDRVYEGITSGENGYVGIKIGNGSLKSFKIQSVDNVSVSRYDISGKCTRITLDDNSGIQYFSHLRSAIVYVRSEPLPLSEVPIDDPVDSGTNELDLDSYYHDLKPGRKVIISGELSDLPGVVRSEAHELESVTKKQGNTYSTITLKNSLDNNFVRDTMRVNANVALATHGETVQEVLGSGNAGASFQKFKLKQPPLTYISSDDPSGTSSSLEIRVNDILWQEVSSFYGHGSDETIYTVRQNSQGESFVTFGDGTTGSRLPTGNQNVRATYRKGIGAAGMLNANQLSQLVSRPLHLKAVNNPVEPSGAQDPESASDIRKNANLTIFTLGRIVSLQDFEDYARAFAGISKAKSVWVWENTKKAVHITIAGEDGAEVPESSLLYTNLKESIEDNLSQKTSFTIENYLPKYFTFTGSLKVDPRYEFDKVHEEIVRTIRDQYSFENREFGQSVALSELIGFIHRIDGVVSVDIDTLYIITADTSAPIPADQPAKLLVARLAEKGAEHANPAELLLITDEPVQLNKMT